MQLQLLLLLQLLLVCETMALGIPLSASLALLLAFVGVHFPVALGVALASLKFARFRFRGQRCVRGFHFCAFSAAGVTTDRRVCIVVYRCRTKQS
jgi:ABC-type sulfate transport system permease subunit